MPTPGPTLPTTDGIRRLWSRIADAFPRVVAGGHRREPRRAVDGIELVLLDRRRWSNADHVFNRAVSALHEIATRAPGAYAALRRDVVRILFVSEDRGYRYHPFQLALVVPPGVALEPDARRYAAWLVRALEAAGHGSARGFLEALLGAHPPEDRVAIRDWLAATEERSRAAARNTADHPNTDFLR